MNICANFDNMAEVRMRGAPMFVPLGLVLTGLALLPFDCIYNRTLAVAIIGIGGYSLFKQFRSKYCCKKVRAEKQAANPDVQVPPCA